MPHDISLIATLAVSFGFALIAGLACARLKIPPIVGYLLAGIVIGPATPGFVADLKIAQQLAEVGIMLLMFGVGLHFSVGDLLAVKRIAVPGAALQIVAATALGMATARFWGWGYGEALVFGISLSVASTVVLLRMLESRGALKSLNGQIAVGWLIVQDIAMILVLVMLPPLAGLLGGREPAPADASILGTLAVTLGKVALFVALMLVIGKRALPWLLLTVARSGSRELFTLCVVASAIAVAYGSAILFDVSFALGAFFAGMMMSESNLSHRAAEESLPLREAFSVLFFVSVGMLFDPLVLVEHPGKVIAVTAIIMIGTPLVAIAIVLLYRYPAVTALTIGASLAQIGEFSFIFATLGTSLNLMPGEGQSLILAGALISISANTLVFAAIRPALEWLATRPDLWRAIGRGDDRLATLPESIPPNFLAGQIVMVGYGRVGRHIARALEANNLPYVVAEMNRDAVKELRSQGKAAVAGDASLPGVLVQAHIANAAMLIIAAPDSAGVQKMIETARALNPKIEILIRTHSEEVAALLRSRNAGTVFLGEHELASAMSKHVLARMGL